MISAIDTNILIDILLGDPVHGPTSKRILDEARELGDLIISEAVYAEVAPRFDTPSGVYVFLAHTHIGLQPSSPEALHRAGQAFHLYTRRRPRGPVCARCGRVQQVACDECGADLQFRQHTLADFLIGGHAVVHADRLLTRDRRTYGRYFPELALA